MEIEIKYVNGKNSIKSVLECSAIAPYIAKPKNIKMSAIYYDTQNGDFANSGFAIRLRQESENSVCALKGGSIINGIANRIEIEANAKNIAEGWQLISNSTEYKALPPILEQESPSFTEKARMEFERTAWEYKDCGLCCEIALDSGMIYAGNGTAPIDELEIELKSGEKEKFLELIADLEKTTKLVRGNKSKYRRAKDLLKSNNA